jgi:outer membrane protein assembly factor BamD
MNFRVLRVLSLLVFLSCSLTEEKHSVQITAQDDVGMYNEGMMYLKRKEFDKSTEIFNELELQHPYSKWASKGQLMSGFSYYSANKYDEAILTLSKFVELNPNHQLIPYAMYLKAYSYYERMPNVNLDQKFSKRAYDEFSELINRYPESVYAKKSKVHLNQLMNHLAAKEIQIGKFYQSEGYYLASIKRYKNVLKDYKKTIHIPESIFRLIECYISIGLVKQSHYLYKILEYNFPKTKWTIEGQNLLKEYKINKNLKKFKKKQLDIDKLNAEDLDLI